MRKIVQIATRPETRWSYGDIVALCDDGSLWWLVFDEPEPEWIAFPPIPQHDLTPWTPPRPAKNKAETCPQDANRQRIMTRLKPLTDRSGSDRGDNADGW